MNIWYVNIFVLCICIVTIIYFLKEHFRLKNGSKQWMQANVWLKKNAPDYVMTCIENFRRKFDRAVAICDHFDKEAGHGGPKFHAGKIVHIFPSGYSEDMALVDFFNGQYQIEVEIKTLNVLCPDRKLAVGDKVNIYVSIE